MKKMIKLLIEEEGIRRTPSIYISILLAYLEQFNWSEAEHILHAFQNLELKDEEKDTFLYLKDLIYARDTESINTLLAYLYR